MCVHICTYRSEVHRFLFLDYNSQNFKSSYTCPYPHPYQDRDTDRDKDTEIEIDLGIIISSAINTFIGQCLAYFHILYDFSAGIEYEKDSTYG